MKNFLKTLHPTRVFALAEAVVAAVAAFMPLTGEQVALICGVFAVLTGEQVRRKVTN
tara:strand:+ start:425 stop:595 length:171 start_codon:yes stop_codon:yes gene_type:complete